jgi:hypothetical protein
MGWPAPAQPALQGLGTPQPGVTVAMVGAVPAIRTLTRAQLQGSVDVQRARQHTIFVSKARATEGGWFLHPPQQPAQRPPPALPMDLPAVADLRRQLVTLLSRLWKVPGLGNKTKEVYWRLTVMGVSGAGGVGICPLGPCVCGAQCLSAADRAAPEGAGGPALHAHYFWDCPVAQAVLRELCTALHPHVTRLHRTHVWLCRSPDPRIRARVWEVVCLAATAAMDAGRRCAWRLHCTAEPATAETDREAVLQASRLAARDFWSRLADFVTTTNNQPKRAWRVADGLSVDHPFVGWAAPIGDLPQYRLVWPEQAAAPLAAEDEEDYG